MDRQQHSIYKVGARPRTTTGVEECFFLRIFRVESWREEEWKTENDDVDEMSIRASVQYFLLTFFYIRITCKPKREFGNSGNSRDFSLLLHHSVWALPIMCDGYTYKLCSDGWKIQHTFMYLGIIYFIFMISYMREREENSPAFIVQGRRESNTAIKRYIKQTTIAALLLCHRENII